MFVFHLDSLVPERLSLWYNLSQRGLSARPFVSDDFESSALLLGLGETGHWAQKALGRVADRPVSGLQQGHKSRVSKVVFSTLTEDNRARKSLKKFLPSLASSF